MTLPGPPNLEHHHLRSALEFAVGVAEAGQKQKPPMPIPAEIKPFFKQSRLAAAALGRVRRIVEGDPDFRDRIAVGAVPELVDPIGAEWLRREPGWEERVEALVEQAEEEAADLEAERLLRRAERRRVAAEEAVLRTRAELVSLTDRVADQDRELSEYRRREEGESAEVAGLRADVAAARQDARHARDRADADRRRLAAVELERDDAQRRAAEAELQRDQLLAARAELGGSDVGPSEIIELRNLAASAHAVAKRLAALVTVSGEKRTAIAVPASVSKDARKAAEFMFAVPGVLVIVDGYNVAKLGWPGLSLQDQRERALDAVDSVARRFVTEIAVIFDGADVVGAHAARRRLARVRYSPAGVTADDIIRAEVSGLDAGRPVVVVTNDVAIRKDVCADGASVIASNTFVDIALR